MLINAGYTKDIHLMRRYYVGITRAKKRLFIHTNGNYFDRAGTDHFYVDQRSYSLPAEIVLQLTHRDVNLGFFKTLKREILSLRSGQQLNYQQQLLHNIHTGQAVAKLSAKMQTTLAEWEGRNYHVKEASIRFIVAWKPKDAPKTESETAVLLADLVLDRC